MGLMLDALKQIESRTSVPMILPLVHGEDAPRTEHRREEIQAAVEPGFVNSAGPSIAESPDDYASLAPTFVTGQPLAWPEGTSVHEPCYAKTADAILHQLSRGADLSDCFLHRPTVIAFTSPGDGDGKTSVLAGLAPQLAQKITASLLVVDANERKPDLSETLGLPSWQDADTGPALIYPTSVLGLNFLPASSCWKGLSWIDDLRQTWPLVLIDTPSLANPDVGPLTRCCDGVYLVVRLGRTPRIAVRQATRAISDAGGRLLGSVVIT